MIVSAAVKIKDLRQDKEVILPCMRHCDISFILHELNYKLNIDYKIIEQGFLDENETFYNRINAYEHAWQHNQLNEEYNIRELFSEDLW